MAQEVLSEITGLAPSHSKELLGLFVSELFLSVAEQERRQMRRERQAEGIAAAKARGVRFGRPAKPLPDNFYQMYQDWRSKKITLQQAASACGMPVTTFYNKAARLEWKNFFEIFHFQILHLSEHRAKAEPGKMAALPWLACFQGRRGGPSLPGRG